MKEININEIIKNVKKSGFFLNSGILLGYVDALPILSVKNSGLYLTIPFLKYKMTGEVDKTLVYPIRYIITVSLPEGKIVRFEELDCNPLFRKVDFNKPVGFFRHEAIKQYNKKEYKEKRKELYALYDKIAKAILYNDAYTQDDDDEFTSLINIMLEPSLKPIYEALDEDFYNKYLDSEG